MLKSISWLQFGSFLLVTGAGYYLYIFGRYYRAEIKSFFTGRKQPTVFKERGALPGSYQAAIKEQPKALNADLAQQKAFIVAGRLDTVAESLPPLSEGSTTDGESSDELFGVMGKVIVLLKEEMRQAIANQVSREEVLPRLASVLGKHQQLKGSQYHTTINDFLTRSCSSKFALLLGEDELERLWN